MGNRVVAVPSRRQPLIAAELGIQDRSRMSEDELIPEILRLAPKLAVKAKEKKKK